MYNFSFFFKIENLGIVKHKVENCVFMIKNVVPTWVSSGYEISSYPMNYDEENATKKIYPRKKNAKFDKN